MQLQNGNDPNLLAVKAKITREGSDAHLEFNGVMMADFACELIARWVLANMPNVEPANNFAVIAKRETGRAKYYWGCNQMDLPRELAEYACKGMTLAPSNRRLILLARELEFYNLDREENRLRPVAIFTHYHSKESELKHFDGTMSEATGMIYKLQSLHTSDRINTPSVKRFFDRAPLRRPNEAREPKKTEPHDDDSTAVDRRRANEKTELIKLFSNATYR